jgi:8-hydroxy-5-deazaflavin:NADPH oxidoreductase
MRVAIIGVGNVGKALGTATIAAGHSVVLAASDPAHAAAAAESVGATAAASNTEAVQGADLVVLAVPGSAVRAVATEIADAVGSGVVVDSTNPLNATYTDLDIEGVSGAADLQALLPSAKVVKAFNTVFASRYAAPTENGEAVDLYIAGDHADAKSGVAELGASLGFPAAGCRRPADGALVGGTGVPEHHPQCRQWLGVADRVAARGSYDDRTVTGQFAAPEVVQQSSAIPRSSPTASECC